MRKSLYIAGGVAVIVLGVLVAPLPGPGGIPVIMVGTVILLRHSPGFRRHYVRLKRRYPAAVGPVDRLIRRRRTARSAVPGQ